MTIKHNIKIFSLKEYVVRQFGNSNQISELGPRCGHIRQDPLVLDIVFRIFEFSSVRWLK